MSEFMMFVLQQVLTNPFEYIPAVQSSAKYFVVIILVYAKKEPRTLS